MTPTEAWAMVRPDGTVLECVIVFLLTVIELGAFHEFIEHARLKNMAELCEAVGGTVTWAKGEFSCAPLPK